MMLRACLLLGMLIGAVHQATACTSASISPGATEDGSAYVTYNADDHNQYGFLNFLPRGTHKPGDMRKIYDVDSREYHGEIPEAAITYNVVHKANEYGVAMGESTFGGLDALSTPYPGSIMDYGSLMDVALQRSTTARDAIKAMGALTATYGYASTGESFSIADGNEAWIMEMIGKGPSQKGAVWVGIRIPDGTITAHANQARITTFSRTDPLNVLFAPDVTDFARTLGYNGTDEAFSFSDFYNPLSPVTVRVCEARVWSIFNRVTANGTMTPYIDYARGWNLTRRMPLYVIPVVKLTRELIFDIMRDTFNGTFFEFDLTNVEIGPGAYALPYRARPLTFEVNGKTYVNERSIATQQTLSNHITQIRPGFPTPALGTVVWFGVDDTLHGVRIPLYTGITAIPTPYAFGIADATVFSFKSAFWVFNMVANLAYAGHSYIRPDIEANIQTFHAQYFKTLTLTDKTVVGLWNNGDRAGAISTATTYSATNGEELVPAWLELYQTLFVKFMDFDVRITVPGQWSPNVDYQQYPDSWYQRIVAATGDHYYMPDSVAGSSLDAASKNTKRRKGVF